MTAIEELNFQAYLESVLNDQAYSDCRHFYTPTDGVIRPKLNLRVQRYQSPRTEAGQEPKAKEVLSVLDGLRKYQSEHVLLVGKPGSGKSTALEKLLLDEAEKAKSDSQVKIPVLVRLRQYQTSVLDLVRDFLMGHGLPEIGQTEQLLTNGRFLLLLDGVNELPSQIARTDLENFRVRYRKFTPMILTTRDLGFGGTVGVEHKLEMEPLTVPQMIEFVKEYLPDQHQQMLQQMGARLRKFAETPLLLVMLCDVFEKHLRIPTNLGEAFREFVQIYDSKLKESNVPIHENSQTVWPELLQHLAFVMMQGSSPTELNLTISKQEAIKLIYQNFKISHEKASLWLEDLLKYHLIQINNGDKIEFRHQLIQEYYSAEYLLRYLDKIEQEKLIHEYLNYIKWTEPLALMVELSEKAEQILQVVNLALEIDLVLGARLVGSVNAKFSDKAIELIVQRKINQILKIKILGKTKSTNALPYLLHALQDREAMTRIYAASALGYTEFIEAVPNLLNALNDDDPNVRSKVAISLGEIGCFDVAEILLARLIDNSEVSSVRFSIAFALRKIGNSKINPILIEELFNAGEDMDWLRITVALEKLANEDTILVLIEKIRNGSNEDRRRGIYTLEKISSKIAIPALEEILENTNEWSLTRAAAAEALGIIGDNSILPILLHFLHDEDVFVRSGCAKSLGNFSDNFVVDILLQILDNDDYRVREPAIYALGSIGSEKVVPKLCSILEENINLEDSIDTERGEGENDIKAAQLAIKNRLINLNKKILRVPAIRALGEIGSEKAIPTLVFLLDRHESVDFVIHSLGGIQSKSVVPILVDFLSNHQDSEIRSGAAISIARIADVSTAPMLIAASNDTDGDVASSSIYALGKVGESENLSFLSNFLSDSIDERLIDASLKAISEIQNRCKFYNFSLIIPNNFIKKSNMNQKSILRIVVASPGDVQAERDLFPGVIDELNRGIAADRNLRLELVRWETDSFPGFHPEGPQGLIDFVLKIEDCNILIGIFWKRFGTPVMDANSGTEHEFLTAYEAWKKKGSPQIMIYFNQKPYNPISSKESEQWTQVLRFKENFPEEGLWWKYEGEADFERKVRNHLTQFIRKYHSDTEQSSTLPAAANIPSCN
jgi:HEAT repeat protein